MMTPLRNTTIPEQTMSAETSAGNTLPPVQDLTRAETRELFDRQARSWLGISGEEFVRRYDAGEITPEQLDNDNDVIVLVMMLPHVR
jgi:hypothetical protein